jgi:hypothetical protein
MKIPVGDTVTMTFASYMRKMMRACLFNHPKDESLRDLFYPDKPYVGLSMAMDGTEPVSVHQFKQ